MKRKTTILSLVSILTLTVISFSACGAKIENENKQILPATTENTDLTTETTSPSEPSSPSETKNQIVSTYDLLLENPVYKTFLDLKIGATKEEVDAVLGEGTAGEKDPFDTSVEPYTYEKDGVSIWISYKDGVVVKKSSKENKDWAVAISKEDFAKVKEGMSYDEVKAIFGEGQITSDAKSSAGTTTTYFWNIKSGYQNITIKFKDGMSSYISNMNMK